MFKEITMGAITKEMIAEDLSGQVFGRLTLLEKMPKITGKMIKYLCLCECGNIKEIAALSLKSGNTKSCGCFRTEVTIARETIHGEKAAGKRSAEYVAWIGMKERCYNKNNPRYSGYGGRGIRVCDRWLNSFENFLQDMGRRPSKKHSVDRYPNNNGDYEPCNCRWATQPQQNRNVRTNRWLEFNGIKLILKDWAKVLDIDSASIYSQLNRKKEFPFIAQYFIAKHRLNLSHRIKELDL